MEAAGKKTEGRSLLSLRLFSSPLFHSQALLYGCTNGTIALPCVKFAILSGMETRHVISGKTFSESADVFVQERLCRYHIRT